MTRLRVSRLGKDPFHRKHMLRTMTTQLFKHERIKTTLPKAMALRSCAERMITLAKTNTVEHALKLTSGYLREKDVVLKLIAVLKLRYLFRQGGYTRVLKCGLRESDKAPMAYIELVDSPKELGKRIVKQKKTHPTLEELREKAPTLDIYNKPVLHVSENKKTSLLGGIALLLNRARMMPIPTVQDFVAKAVVKPNLHPEFSNIPGPGQPGEQEAVAAAEASVEAIKKHATEVHARRKIEKRDERTRLRAKLGIGKKKKDGKTADNNKKAEVKA